MSPVSGTLVAHAGPGASALVGVTLVFAASLWTLGTVRMLTGRPGLRRAVGVVRPILGLVGVVVVGAALAPTVERLAEQTLWVHMVQHLALGLVGPLLIVVGRPVLVLSSVLEPDARRRLDRRLGGLRRRVGIRGRVVIWAAVAAATHVGVWWAWHVPALYDLAIGNDLVHAAEHAGLFWAGVLLWWVCLEIRWRERGPVAVLTLFAAAVGTGVVGALLTIAPEPVYATSAAGVRRWGLTRLSDQQLAGAIMWVAGGALYLAAATLVALRWLLAGPRPGQAMFVAAPRSESPAESAAPLAAPRAG